MGSTDFQFDRGELVVVGGDYGEIHLAAATPEARLAIESLVGAARHGGHSTVGCLRVSVPDDATAYIENRDAGRSSQVDIEELTAGGTDGSDSEESLAARSDAPGQPQTGA